MPDRADRIRRPRHDRDVVAVSLERRRALKWLALPPAGLLLPSALWANVGAIASARIWPAQEYTRLILEAAAPLPHQLTTLKDPPRVVLDLDGVDLNAELTQLPIRVQQTDPYISGIRFGRKAPATLRVVIDLRGEVKPQVFALKPVAEFGHRLVLDLYPTTPLDPLMALLEEKEATGSRRCAPRGPGSNTHRAAPPARGGDRRRITIAIDPGHGGEDPGAVGRRGTCEKDVVLAISRRLKSMVDAEPGMRAMLTRDDDYFVPLAARVQKARRVQADLLISIHADAFRESRRAGRRCSRCPRTARRAPRRSGWRRRRMPRT